MRASPRPDTLPFPPHGRRDLPIQIASIFLRSDVGESLPATQLVFCLYLSNTASLDLPLDAGASSPARQPYLSNLLLRGLPVRHGDSETSRTSARASGTNSLTFSNLLLDQAYPSDTAISKPVGRRREPPGQTTFLFHPAAGKAYPTTLPVDCEAFQPLNFALLSKPSDSASPDLPTDAGESTPGQTILSFQVHARRGLPVRHGSSETTVDVGESLPPDNLTISSPKLGRLPVRHGDC